MDGMAEQEDKIGRSEDPGRLVYYNFTVRLTTSLQSAGRVDAGAREQATHTEQCRCAAPCRAVHTTPATRKNEKQ
jgi:hypothetical protein